MKTFEIKIFNYNGMRIYRLVAGDVMQALYDLQSQGVQVSDILSIIVVPEQSF